MDINNPYYQDHVALRGGLFYLIDGFDVTIDNGALGYARAVYDDSVNKNYGFGGGFYVTAAGAGAAQGDLTVRRLRRTYTQGPHIGGGVVSHFEAADDGGLIWSDHDNFHLSFDNCVWDNYYSGGEGGIIYGKVVDFEQAGALITCELTNITAVEGSAFFASK